MSTLICQTAGESHGPALTTFMTGLPAGLTLDVDFINAELRRRQGGYGRGGRQKIETDQATFLAGVRMGETTGGPLVIQIANRDSRLDDPERTPPVYRPRPGHADLAGSVKWLTTDCRATLERASARETAARTAGGAVARCLLRAFGIEIIAFVQAMLDVKTTMQPAEQALDDFRSQRDASAVYCPDADASEQMIQRIRQAKIDKDTVGGLIEVHVFGCPIGLGSCVQWDQKLDARLAGAVMGIQAFKSVEIGMGRDVALHRGSDVHDPIQFDETRRNRASLGFVRSRNNAGGLEGGMTNGMPIVIRAAMKPISTLLRGMPSVDLNTRQPEHSDYERSDVSALPAASVVMENVVGFEIARAFLEKFGGDSMHEIRSAYAHYLETARQLPLQQPDAITQAAEDDTET